MAKLKGLGRGLDALLGEMRVDTPADQLLTLHIDQLKPGKYQPRTRMDQTALAELAASIKSQGLMQPILVRLLVSGGYEIIAGERRWRAARMAGLMQVPVVVRVVADEAALAMALIENIQREDLNPLEEAVGIQRLVDEFGMTHDSCAQVLGRSRSAVSNLLRLLNLPEPVRQMVSEGDLDMGHARALLSLPVMQQIELAKQVVDRGLSVRETEKLVQRMLEPLASREQVMPDPDVLRLEEEISESIGTKVRIQSGKRGAGKITIEYGSLDQLDGLLARLR
ncbi:ParB family chromosome partitioning protein [Chitinivorax tropicus]|uniref:ParB family chromosome partitioning protein n=1 Tax=Chitinivorax tropicus TaxID=714531 RepID=A0A840MMU9_9PROT|nr:ParB/RepB/Spo0J family partition protein [Chitinivorax tropicus]MBB5018062.1 ParB family chromosome partitioning protein [Chitinivorax tropicus]